MKKSFLMILFLLVLTSCAQQPKDPEKYIGIEAAKAAALADAALPADAPADFSTTGLDRANGEDFYAVNFTADGVSYQYEIHPVTGAVIRANSQGPRLIGDEAAQEIALQHAGLTADQVTVLPIEQDIENGRQVYDIEFYTADRKEYDYDIDAATGEIISFDYDAEHALPQNTTNAPITADQARSIALAKVPGASSGDIWDFEADYDDGRLEYEIEIRYNGMEYDFEIDGTNGTILEMDSEPIS